MKFNSGLLFCCLSIVSCCCVQANCLDEAIRKSDVKTVQKMLALKELSAEEKASYAFLAKEVLRNRRDALKKRRARVIASTVFKFLPIPLVPIIGFCMDIRGLGATLGLYSAIIALCAAANDGAPVAVGALACGVGCIFLEKFCWAREARIQKDLQDDYDNAVAIKVALMQVQATA